MQNKNVTKVSETFIYVIVKKNHYFKYVYVIISFLKCTKDSLTYKTELLIIHLC